jgi:hypothetical protein
MSEEQRAAWRMEEEIVEWIRGRSLICWSGRGLMVGSNRLVFD